jgi:hypothetical protein
LKSNESRVTAPHTSAAGQTPQSRAGGIAGRGHDSGHYGAIPASSGRRSHYSHSMVLSDDNALIFHGKFFYARERTVSPIRQKFALLISNTNFDDLRFSWLQRLSTSIGRFFRDARENDLVEFIGKDRQS